MTQKNRTTLTGDINTNINDNATGDISAADIRGALKDLNDSNLNILSDLPLTVSQGGTGQITANSALNALLPTQTAANGKILASNGADASWQAPSVTAPASPAGSVQFNNSGAFGAAAITNNGTGLLQATNWQINNNGSASLANTAFVLDSSGNATAASYVGNNLTANAPVFTDGSKKLTSTGTIPVGNGGTGTAAAFTTGSIIYSGGSGVYSQDNANFFWDATNHRLGLGTASPVTSAHIIKTTEQLRVGYDSSNYYSTTVSSTGAVTFDAVGSGAGFILSDSVTVTGDLTFSTGTTRTVKGADSLTGNGDILAINSANGFTGGFAGGNLNITTGSATARITSGNASLSQNAGAFAAIGGTGADSLIAGSSNTAGRGGNINLTGGNGGQAGAGTSSNISGTGGAVTVLGGTGGTSQATTASGTNRGGTGGTISYTGGQGGSGTSGPSDGGAGGALSFNGGSPGQAGTGRTGGAGGAINFTGNIGGSSITGSTSGNTGGAGSSLILTSGSGGAATTSGAVSVTSGSAGNITFTGNNGGTVTGAGGTTTAGNGGTIGFTAGNGGATAGTGTFVTGAAGAINFTAGNGGSLVSSGTGKDGGAINLTAGNGTSLTGTTNNGGSVYVLAGAKSPSGADGNIYLGQNSAGTARGTVIAAVPLRLKAYTVATLPTGTQGDTAFVTDATAPTYLGALTGGGAVVAPVFYNGTAWISY